MPLPANRMELFQRRYSNRDLKRKSARGGAATMTATGIRFILMLVGNIALARLLRPEDFGLFAMVMSIVVFIQLFKDMGLSMATVQKAEINHAQVSTLFWFNIAVSLLLLLITLIFAPFIARFYREPKLSMITSWLACSFILSGLTIQHQALLRRNMRFGELATVEIVAAAIGILGAVLLAWGGAGYWALIAMPLLTNACLAAGVWLKTGWIPGLPKRKTGISNMLRFGLDVTGFEFLNYFARHSDNILLGRFFGAYVLGLYSKAYQIMMLPIVFIRQPLTTVAMPALSSMQQEPQRYRRYYMTLVSLLAILSMPLVVIAGVCAKSLIGLLLGQQWLGAVVIFQILAITAFLQPVGNTKGLVMLSLGLSRRYLKWGAINSVITVASFAIGIRWGALGIATSYCIMYYLTIIPGMWYCLRGTPVSIALFFRAISQPATAALMMAGVLILTSRCLADQGDAILLGVNGLVGVLVYVGLLAILPRGLEPIRRLLPVLDIPFIKRIYANSTPS